jgi:hypothetical protein
MPTAPSFRSRYGRLLARHDLRRSSPAASPWQGLLLGNGDMGAAVWGPEHALHFRLNKLDLWDSRWPVDPASEPLPLSEFKRVAAEESQHLADGERISRFDLLPWDPAHCPYPCLRTAADLALCVSPFHSRNTPTQRLRLIDATYECRWTFAMWGEHGIAAEAFLCYARNILALRVRMDSFASRYVALALRRDPLGGRTDDMLRHGEWGLREWRDPRVGMLPPAAHELDGSLAVLTQLLPGDDNVDPCTYAVVAYSPDGPSFGCGPGGEPVLEADPALARLLRASPQVRRDEEGADTVERGAEREGEAESGARELTCYVAVATEREGPDPAGRATALVHAAAEQGWEALHRKHAAAWEKIWSANRVELADRNLERQWYRSTYLLACNAKPGGPAPGLFGVAVPYDCPPWRSDRHNNWPEYSSLFWGAFVSNHLDLAMNYAEHTSAFLPTARRLAREIYECDGAAFGHLFIDYSRRYYFDNLWSRSLYLTAINAQNLWWHYQYSQDRAYLQRWAYPVMRECADFYVSLVRKNEPGCYDLWPTVPCEYRGFLKDLALSRNCLFDLALVKFLLRATLEASLLLGADEDKRPGWQDLLDHVPPYQTIEVEGKTVFQDVTGNPEIPPYNHPVGIGPLFPGEDPECFGSGRWREIAENTLRWRKWADFEVMAYARLGDGETAYRLAGGGRPARREEDANVTWASARGLQHVGELLLSSWDGVIRLFPAWPLEKAARFENLRANGAFLVSAECGEGRIGAVTIQSEAGAEARVARPWPEACVIEENTGREVPAAQEVNCLRFATTAGGRYRIEPRD